MTGTLGLRSGTLADTTIFSRSAITPIDIGGTVLPARLRPSAELAVLDISEYVGEQTGGVRTYLAEKARYVGARGHLRQVVLIPGDQDAIVDTSGVRCYRLRGPAIPFHPAYRFMLATRSTSRVVAHERPDIIEVGSAYFAPWLIFRARRQHRAPVVWFYHANLPRLVAPRGPQEALPRRMLGGAVAGYTRRIAGLVNRTIVASDFARRELEAHRGREHRAHSPRCRPRHVPSGPPRARRRDACALRAARGAAGPLRRAACAARSTPTGWRGRGHPSRRGQARRW